MINNRKTLSLLIISVPQVILVSYLLFIKGLYYATLDDLLIGDIIRGAFTGGEFNAVYTSPIYNILVHAAYSIFPDIGWFGISLVLIELTAMLVSDLIISSECDDMVQSCFTSVVLFVCWYLMWHHFTYTTVAYSAVLCATVALYCLLDDEKSSFFYKIAFVSFFIIAVLVRKDTLVSMIIILFPLFIRRSVRKKRVRYIYMIVGLGIVYMLAGLLNNGLIKILENDGYEWNESIEYIGDHMDKQDVYESGVWDECEVECFYEQIMYDKDIYSIENADRVADYSRGKPFKEKIATALARLQTILNELRHPKRYENIYFVVLVLLFLLNCIAGRKYMIDSALIISGFILTLAVFAYINRYLYRTVMPGGVLAIMLLMLVGGYCSNKRLSYAGIAVSAGICILMIVTWIPYMKDRASQYDTRNIEAADYFASHQDKLYLAAQTEAFGLMNCIPLIGVPPYDKANLVGNWNMYTGSYYAIVDDYGIDDPDHLVRSIPDNDVIRLVARTENGVPDHFLDFISEHSGNDDVHAELEDTFYTVWMGEWGVYRIKSTLERP